MKNFFDLLRLFFSGQLQPKKIILILSIFSLSLSADAVDFVRSCRRKSFSRVMKQPNKFGSNNQKTLVLVFSIVLSIARRINKIVPRPISIPFSLRLKRMV